MWRMITERPVRANPPQGEAGDGRAGEGMPPSLTSLLKESLRKSPYHLFQYNGRVGGDDVFEEDGDGHAISATWIWDLQTFALPLRVQILDGAKRDDIVTMLLKIAEHVEHHLPETIDWESEQASEDAMIEETLAARPEVL